MECNRCFCTSAAKLLCTQIACVDWFNKKSYKIQKKLIAATRQGKAKETLRNKKIAPEKTEGKANITVKNINLSSDEVNANKMLVADDKTLKNKKLSARENKSNKTIKNNKVTAKEGDNNETLEVKKLAARQSKTNKTQLKKKTKARKGRKRVTGNWNTKKGMKPLEELPTGNCQPGRVYKSKCKRCFCDDTKKAKCALKTDACTDRDGVVKPINTPEDVRPPFVREELKKIKTLTSATDKCEPGFKYKVICNLCVCTERRNLLCSKELCLSFEDINRVEAAEKTGQKCTQDPSPTRKGCVECKCVKGKLSCADVPNCFADTRMKLSSGGKNDIKMKLDPMKEKCVPQGIYRDNCNRCYCQKDGTLRCTQKTCLVYSQAEQLRKQLNQLKS